MCETCSHGALPQALLEDIAVDISTKGWCLAGFDEDGDELTHTIGFHTRDMPELASPGMCRCHDIIVATLADRQRRAGAFEHGQITQVQHLTLRLERLPDPGRLELLTRYYRHHSLAPVVLVARSL